MTAILQLPAAPTDLPPLPLHRFSVDQYHRMVGLGILSSEDPVELLEGLVIIKGGSTLAPCIRTFFHDSDRVTHPVPIRRFTVPEYHLLIQDGILNEDDHVELLEGWVVQKMPRKPAHDAILAVVMRILAALLPAGWHCRNQSALTTGASEPEPDLAVVRGAERDYLSRHPRPHEVGLAVEISDTTLASDRSLKGPIFAGVSIPTYWIVNLVENIIEVYTMPTGPDAFPAYGQRKDYGPSESIPFNLNGIELARIPVRDLLP